MKIILPLYIHTTKSETKKGKFILNLNNYRNTHFQKLNKAKVYYEELIIKMLPVVKYKEVEIEYTYFAKTKRRMDVSNPCSIIDKFTCDALTKAGLWKDDDINTIKKVSYIWGGVDKDNPRCELTIKEI